MLLFRPKSFLLTMLGLPSGPGRQMVRKPMGGLRGRYVPWLISYCNRGAPFHSKRTLIGQSPQKNWRTERTGRPLQICMESDMQDQTESGL